MARYTNWLTNFAIVSLAAGLTACGGDDGNSVQPTNRAPQFTASSFSGDIAENTTDTIVAVSAADPDGDPVRYTLTGADAARFQLDDAGNLSFREPANFEIPADNDGDNIFVLEVRASDGRLSDVLPVEIRLTNDREGIVVRRIATGLVDPVGMDSTDAARTLLVGQRDGTLYEVDGQTGERSIRNQVALTQGAELLDVAFGKQAGFVTGPVIMYRQSDSVWARVVDYTCCATTRLADGPSEGVKGSLFFDDNDTIYAAVGDPNGERAQGDSGYGSLFTQGDPYSGASVRFLVLDKIGRGIRQPGGLAVVGDRLALADQGGSVEHEISRFWRDTRGLNFNWPFREGNVLLQNGGPTDGIDPALVYPFGQGEREGRGIVMGAAYTGNARGIREHFVFGDINGTVWSIPLAILGDGSAYDIRSIERRPEDFAPDRGTIDSIVAIKADASGVLYILDADGDLFRVDSA